MPATQTHRVSLQFHGLGREDEEIEIAPGTTTFEDLLREREIHPETVLVFCQGDVVPAGDAVPEGAEEIKVLHIVSGGA